MRSTFKLKGGFTIQRLRKLAVIAYRDLVSAIGEKTFIGHVEKDPEIYVREWLTPTNASSFYDNLKGVADNISKAKMIHLRFKLVPSVYLLRFCMDSKDTHEGSSVDYVLNYDPDTETVSVSFDILFKTCSDNMLASFDKYGGIKVFLEFVEYYTELAEDLDELCVCLYCLDYNNCTKPKKTLQHRCCKNFRRNRLSSA